MALALLLAVPVGASAPLSMLGSGDLDPKEMEQYDKRADGSGSSGSTPGTGSRRSDDGNFGVVWAVTGDSSFWKEVARSAYSLKIHKQNATVFTTMNELGACGRTSDAEKEASWSCKVASVAAGVVLEKAEREAKATAALAVTADGEGPKRNSLSVSASIASAARRLLLFWHDLEQGGNGTAARANGKMISRMIKMTALLAAPYDHALFLDTDTYVCKPWPELLELVKLGGFMRAFDFALAQNHMDSMSFPAKALWDHYGVPQAFAELNSGVIFFRPHSPGVQSVLTDWLDLYLSEDYIQRTTRKPNRRGRGDGAGDQIALTISLYHALEARRVTLYTLTGNWNFLNYRRDYVHPLTDECCSTTRKPRDAEHFHIHAIDIIIDHDCVWNGERRNDNPDDGRNLLLGAGASAPHVPHRHHEPGDRHQVVDHETPEPGYNTMHPHPREPTAEQLHARMQRRRASKRNATQDVPRKTAP
jgi:hypothetical protein